VAVVSAQMVAASERAAATWTKLRAMARGAAGEAVRSAAEGAGPSRPAPGPAPLEADALQKLAESLLKLSGYGQDESFFKRRLREFVQQEKGANGDAA
jgi:hypothetical protein